MQLRVPELKQDGPVRMQGRSRKSDGKLKYAPYRIEFDLDPAYEERPWSQSEAVSIDMKNR